jgi:hypothetical protein
MHDMGFEQIFILQIIAHLLADFILQPQKYADEKNNKGFKSNFLKWHILLVFLFSWIFSFQIYFATGALLIAAIHWLTDGIKVRILNNRYLSRYAFFIDQSVHLLLIFIITRLYFSFFETATVLNLSVSVEKLAIILGYVFCSKPSNIVIKEIFAVYSINVKKESPESTELPNAGKLIGIIERWLVLTFILLGQFDGVGFLLAAKSILRFKDTDILKTEYVLIGTMLSFGLAISSWVLISLIK